MSLVPHYHILPLNKGFGRDESLPRQNLASWESWLGHDKSEIPGTAGSKCTDLPERSCEAPVGTMSILCARIYSAENKCFTIGRQMAGARLYRWGPRTTLNCLMARHRPRTKQPGPANQICSDVPP